MARLFAMLLALVATVMLGAAQAAEVEIRNYTVKVDNKPSGHYKMTIRQESPGQEVMHSQAKIHVRWFVFTYNFAYDGIETWKNGLLTAFESKTKEDGEDTTVKIGEHDGRFKAVINGKERSIPRHAYPNSYWRLPSASQKSSPMDLLEVDTGQCLKVSLKPSGSEKLRIAGVLQPCQRYRVEGQEQAELWFDASERLVRHSYQDDGHRVVIELN